MRLLVADDEQTIREGLGKLIPSFNLDIDMIGLAADGEETLLLAEEYNPDLILIDINMPRLNGLEAIETLRNDYVDAKIIILSGYDKFAYAKRALELGVFAYLLKPVDFEELYVTLCSAIEAIRVRAARPLETTKAGVSQQNTAEAVLAYIHKHFTENTLTFAELARQCHISPSYLTRILKKSTNCNFTEYLGKLRITYAQQLLTDTSQYSIREVAEKVGFSSQHYFSRSFKMYTGLSPSEYRAQNKL